MKQATIKYFNLLDTNNFDNQAMKNIFNDDAFQKLYSPVFINDKKNNTGYFVFAGVDFISHIKNDSMLSVQEIILKREKLNLD